MYNQSQLLIGDWIDQFQQHYFSRRACTPKSQSTWHKDYWAVLKRLPPDQVLTPEILTATILGTLHPFKMKLNCLLNKLDVQVNRECKRYLGEIVPPLEDREGVSVHNLDAKHELSQDHNSSQGKKGQKIEQFVHQHHQ